MNARTILANNLKGFRANCHLSQEELAARAEMSTRGYGKIERGEVCASLETLNKLVDGTGLSYAELLQN